MCGVVGAIYKRSDSNVTDYMIKGLIISKITYMIEILKSRLNQDFAVADQDTENSLAYVEPIGNA